MLSCQKDHFTLPPDLHYLNGGYMSPLPRRVEKAGIDGLQRKRVPAGIAPEDFFEDADRARRLFAQLIHAPDPERIALIPAASYGLAIAAQNTPVRAGQNLVVLHEQFPSNVYTWRRLADARDATLRTVTPPDGAAGRGRRWNERLLDAIDADTALVAVPHIHWADGTLFDLEQIGARARSVGAALIVDGTQSVGALPFDVGAVQPDALVCASYKWLLGPYGLGLAYLGARYDEGTPLEENWINRLGSEHFSRLVNYQTRYQPKALRYDVGERSNFILLPMVVAGLELLLEWGVADVQAYCQALSAEALREIQDLGFSIEAASARSAHLFGVRVPAHVPMNTLRTALAAHRISVSIRGSAVRISPNVYNDQHDMQALRAAFHACLQAV